MEDSRSLTPPASGSVPACDRRLEPRTPVRPVEYIEVGESNGGIILDISEHGMAISAAQLLGGDQTLCLRFQLPRLPDIIETVGEISWIGESKKRAGIRFVDLPESARQQIQQWIALQTADATPPARVADQAFPSLVPTASEPSARPSPAGTGNLLSKMASPSFTPPQEAECENLLVANESQKPTKPRNPAKERRSIVRKSVNASALCASNCPTLINSLKAQP